MMHIVRCWCWYERDARESERTFSASPTHVLKSVGESDWSGPIFLSSWWLWYHHHPHAITVILIVSCWSLVLVLLMREVHNPKVNNGICSTVGLSLSLKGFQQCSCLWFLSCETFQSSLILLKMRWKSRAKNVQQLAIVCLWSSPPPIKLWRAVLGGKLNKWVQKKKMSVICSLLKTLFGQMGLGELLRG